MRVLPTRKIKDLNKNSKNRLRMYKASMIGKPKNFRLKKLINLLGYDDENSFFKVAKKQYNQELITNTREKRNRTKYLYRLKQDIKNKDEFIKKGLDDGKFMMILNEIQRTKKKYLLTWGESFYALSDKKINELKQRFKRDGSFFVMSKETYGSDDELVYALKNNKIKFKLVKDWAKYQSDKGAFFDMVNKTPFDLSEFQIFNDFKASNYDSEDICLIHSLKLGGLSDEKLKEIRAFVKVRTVPKNKLKEISDILNIKIKVKTYDEKVKKNIIIYGTNNEEVYDIGLINNHYFLIKPLNITKYALMNCFDNELTKRENWEELIFKCGRFLRARDRFLDSYELIKLLYINKDKFLKEISLDDEVYKSIYHPKFNHIETLEYSDDCVRLNQVKEVKKNNDIFINKYLDFETTTDGECHIPYLARIAGEEKEFLFKNNFIKDKNNSDIHCEVRKMLYHIVKKNGFNNIRFIAHNAFYDIKFIFDCIVWDNVINREGSLLRAYGKFYYEKGKYVKIEVQCSRAFLPCKLKDFAQWFKLDIKKEVMPYGLYNSKILKNPKNWEGVNIKKIIRFCIEENISFKSFYMNALEWNLVKGDKIDIIGYSSRYCLIDCEVLRKGWEIFEKWISEGIGLDVNNYISISSLVDNYFRLEGVYDGVYEVSGHVREFIQRAMVGGRTMMRKNKKAYFKQENPKKVIKHKLMRYLKKTTRGFNINDFLKKLLDFDSVSLYPSSQHRLGGYLKGKPKVITDLQYESIKDFDGYFMEIEILKVDKKLDFPLMSFVNDEGVRIFSNKMENKRIYVDKTFLEDLIQFQKVKFKIIRGYYYDEGRNYKLKDIIKKLFDKRIEMKKIKNPAQVMFKLMMNASYGKTLIKPFETDSKIMNFKTVKPFIDRNYHLINSIDILSNKKWEELTDYDLLNIKIDKPINNHFNNAPCGVEVLSNSKRIMNEVMVLAQDLNIKIYYQDTDSLHIESSDVEILESKFKEKYQRELIGKYMGQFHSDFDSEFLKEDSIYSVESVFLGKKCYLDKLWDGETVYEEGKDKGSPKYDYHIRMKGMNRAGIIDGANKYFNGDLMKLYKYLLVGNDLELDLTAGGVVPSFEFLKNGNIRSRREFLRTMNFKGDYKIKLNEYEGKI